jgi:hypothetical protein
LSVTDAAKINPTTSPAEFTIGPPELPWRISARSE